MVLQCLSTVNNYVVMFIFMSSYVSSSVSSSLESGSGMDMLFNVLIWGLWCSHLSRVSLYFMGNFGLSVLLLAVHSVDVSADVDCVSSPDVECVSVSSSGSELVDFWEMLVDYLDSLDLLGAGESDLYSGIGLSASAAG